MIEVRNSELLQSATAIVVAQLSSAVTATADVPAFIKSVYDTLRHLEGEVLAEGAAADGRRSVAAEAALPAQASVERARPAVPIEESVHRDHIICLEDGKPLRMLKRYLMAQYSMTPEDYRAKWGLPPSYPMVAPALAEQRSRAAFESGLGKANTGRKRAAGAGKRARSR